MERPIEETTTVVIKTDRIGEIYLKRKLASIQKISQIVPVKNSDFIEKATVLGWDVIVKKGVFNVGDKCIYIEVDGFLPVTDERFEFLRSNSYKKNELVGEGFRIRSMKLRGQVSQGLLFTLSDFPELQSDLAIGTDVSDELKIVKYEVPEQQTGIGKTIGDFSPVVRKTDELRLQSVPTLLKELIGKPYYISVKMDGTSSTIEVRDGAVRAFSRSNELKDDETSVLWKWIHKNNLVEKMKAIGKDFSIQGELCGPKIQGNHLKLTEFEVFMFNVNDERGQRLGVNDLVSATKLLGVQTVPIIEFGNHFDYTMAELIEQSKGFYPSGIRREGIVVRPQSTIKSDCTQSNLSFKIINNDFLLKVEA